MKIYLDNTQITASTEKLKRFKYPEKDNLCNESMYNGVINGVEFVELNANDLKNYIKAFDLLGFEVIRFSLEHNDLNLICEDIKAECCKSIPLMNGEDNHPKCKYSIEYLKKVLNSFSFKANDTIKLGFRKDNPLILKINKTVVVVAPRVDLE